MDTAPKHILAQFFSYFLHPGILPTAGTLYVLYVLPDVYDYASILRLCGTVFMGTYLAPLIGTLLLRRTGVISSIHLIDPKDRIYPYITSAACMLATANYLSRGGAPIEIIFSVLAAAIVLLYSTIVLPFFKSSAHMAGITGFVALYIGMHERYSSGNLQGLLYLIALCGAVAWARTSLKRHTPRELLSGSIIGFSVLFILLSK